MVFKVTFQVVTIANNVGRLMRALVLAVSQIPGQPGWLNAILICEDGSTRQQPITTIEFELSKRNLIALVEQKNERAPQVVYDFKQNGG